MSQPPFSVEITEPKRMTKTGQNKPVVVNLESAPFEICIVRNGSAKLSIDVKPDGNLVITNFEGLCTTGSSQLYLSNSKPWTKK